MHKTEVSASDIGIIASKWNVKTQKQTFQSSTALQPICTQLPFLRQSDEGNTTGTYNSNFGAKLFRHQNRFKNIFSTYGRQICIIGDIGVISKVDGTLPKERQASHLYEKGLFLG